MHQVANGFEQIRLADTIFANDAREAVRQREIELAVTTKIREPELAKPQGRRLRNPNGHQEVQEVVVSRDT